MEAPFVVAVAWTSVRWGDGRACGGRRAVARETTVAGSAPGASGDARDGIKGVSGLRRYRKRREKTCRRKRIRREPFKDIGTATRGH